MRLASFARPATALLLGLAWAWMVPAGSAQPPKPKFPTFKTKDQVEIHGTFYPSRGGRDSWCVLMLHGLGGNKQQQGWDRLAQDLQKEDFAVLTFDFRGHGDSKNVSIGSPGGAAFPPKPGFWDTPINRQMATKRFNQQNPAKTIDYKEFNAAYYPMLANDIVAAKMYLDERNDAGECNSSRLIVVGAKEGAMLGLVWMASECYRYKVVRRPPEVAFVQLGTDAEANDLSCGVWLSMSPSLGSTRLPTNPWLELIGQKYEVPMGFLYGDQDQSGATFAKNCVTTLQKGSRNKLTADRAIKGTKLVGHDLLNKDLETADSIVKYLKKVREDRKGPDWKSKKPGETGYFWNFGAGRMIEAKGEREEVMNLVPLSQLLR